ncbi:MAG: hypothetical protein WCC59_17145 [Terriglobales bacterium]
MRHLILGGGSLVAAGLTLISLYLNYDFSRQIGGLPFALGSVGLDLFKITLPVIIVVACTARGHSWLMRGVLALCALAVWVPITVLGLQSAGGAALLGRADSTGNRTGLIEKRSSLDAERGRILGKNPWSAQIEKWKALPSAAITAEMAGYKTSWMWGASDHCEKVEGAKIRTYCQIFHTMEAARQVALEVEADKVRLTAIEQELAKTPVLIESDPLSKALGDLAKTDPKWVVYGWAFLLAFLLEIVPNIGPALLMLAYKLSQTAPAQPLDRPIKRPNAEYLARPDETGLARTAGGLPIMDGPEKTKEKQEHGKVVDLVQYRLARPAGQTKCTQPSLSRPSLWSIHEAVLAAARELGRGQHSLDKIMQAVKRAAREKGVDPPHRNHIGAILIGQGHEYCGRQRLGNSRATVYNLTEHGLTGAANR